MPKLLATAVAAAALTLAAGAAGTAAAVPSPPSPGTYTYSTLENCRIGENQASLQYQQYKSAQDAEDTAIRARGQLPPYRGGGPYITDCKADGRGYSFTYGYAS